MKYIDLLRNSRFSMVKKAILDGTEKLIDRPKNQEKQKDNYSGRTSHASYYLNIAMMKKPEVI